MRLPINAQCWNKKTRSMHKNFQNVQTFLLHIIHCNDKWKHIRRPLISGLDIVFGGFQALLPFFLGRFNNVLFLLIWYLPLWNLKKLPYRFLPLMTFKIQTVYIAFKGNFSEKIFLKNCCKSLFLAEQLCEMGGSRHIKTVQNYPRAQRHDAWR